MASVNGHRQTTRTESVFSALPAADDHNRAWTPGPVLITEEPVSEEPACSSVDQGTDIMHLFIEEAINKTLLDMPIRLINTETGVLQDHGAIRGAVLNHPSISSAMSGVLLRQCLQDAGLVLEPSNSLDSISNFFAEQQKSSLGHSPYDLRIPHELFSSLLKIAFRKGAATNAQVNSLVWNKANVLAGHNLPNTGIHRPLVLDVYQRIIRVSEFLKGNLEGRVRKVLAYTMLSHRWGKDKEVLMSDLKKGDSIYQVDLGRGRSRGLKKLQEFCCTTLKHGYHWAWADTCCIDRGSSSELQESITSMFKWYRNSSLTIVYLHDLLDPSPARTRGTRKKRSNFPPLIQSLSLASAEEDVPFDQNVLNALLCHKLGACEWFERGWTLQELLGPRTLRFYSGNWRSLERTDGSRRLFNQKDDPVWLASIERITQIEMKYLCSDGFIPGLDDWAVKLKWAEDRQTERPEDKAYCLLGILDITMDIRYGEGKKAEIRLEDLIRQEGPRAGRERMRVALAMGENRGAEDFFAHLNNWLISQSFPPALLEAIRAINWLICSVMWWRMMMEGLIMSFYVIYYKARLAVIRRV